jgi:hypothetical protein
MKVENIMTNRATISLSKKTLLYKIHGCSLKEKAFIFGYEEFHLL